MHGFAPALVRVLSIENMSTVNGHRISLQEALVAPRMISLIARQVKNGRVKDENLTAWFVGQERRPGGYKIVLSEDGSQFGLASNGFPHDKALILVGWYGDLLTTFLGMEPGEERASKESGRPLGNYKVDHGQPALLSKSLFPSRGSLARNSKLRAH